MWLAYPINSKWEFIKEEMVLKLRDKYLLTIINGKRIKWRDINELINAEESKTLIKNKRIISKKNAKNVNELCLPSSFN